MLLVNLLAALNFANVFLNKNVWKIKKTLKNVKKRDQNKKTFFIISPSFAGHLYPAANDALSVQKKLRVRV